MKPLPNDIVLRPRFQLELSEAKEELLQSFEKSQAKPFLVKRLDEHLFIKFDKENNHFWSPQLHLEIDEVDEKNCKLYGVFGPNPTLWTFFMFLHFAVAAFFIVLSMWSYVSVSLDKPILLQLGLMGLLLFAWVILYIFGRLGKRKGRPQIQELYGFMIKIVIPE